MRRRGSVCLNLGTSMCYQLIILLSGFVVPKIILNTYGTGVNGLVSSLSQFIGYAALLEAGLGGAAIYALYKPLNENDDNLISQIIVTTKKLYVKVGNAFILAIVMLGLIYPLVVKVQGLSYIATFLLVIMLSGKNVVDFYLFSKYRALLTADNRLYVINIASAVFQVLNVLIITTLAMLKINIIIVYFSSLLPLMIRSFILWFYVRKKFPNINYGADSNPALLENRWSVLFLNLVQAAQGAGPTIIATFLLGLNLVSAYSIYNVVFSGIIVLLNMIAGSFQSYFGKKISAGVDDVGVRYRYFDLIFTQLVAIVSAIALLLVVDFIKLYIGPNHAEIYYDYKVGALMAINLLLVGGRSPGGLLVIAAGHYKQTRTQSFTQMIFLMVFGVLFSALWGLQGLILGMIISGLYRWIDLQIYAPKKILQVPIAPFLFQAFAMVILFFTIVITAPILFEINGQTWGQWIITGIKCALYGLGFSIVITCLTIKIKKIKKEGFSNGY